MIETQIYDEDTALPYFRVTIDGWEAFGCSLQGVDPEHREWLVKRIAQGVFVWGEKRAHDAVEKKLEDVRRVLGVEAK